MPQAPPPGGSKLEWAAWLGITAATFRTALPLEPRLRVRAATRVGFWAIISAESIGPIQLEPRKQRAATLAVQSVPTPVPQSPQIIGISRPVASLIRAKAQVTGRTIPASQV